MTIEQAATVQAIAAVVIVALTAALVYTAFNALSASEKQATAAERAIEAAQKQATAAERAIEAAQIQATAAERAIEASRDQAAEMRRDRHFANLPVLKVQLEKIDTSVVNALRVVMHLLNKNDAAALNVHIWAHRLHRPVSAEFVSPVDPDTGAVDCSRKRVRGPCGPKSIQFGDASADPSDGLGLHQCPVRGLARSAPDSRVVLGAS